MIKENNYTRKTVTFVPYYGIGNCTFYNNLYYFDDKYVDFQLNILKLFSQLTQFNFIIKCVKTHPQAQFSKITRDWISINNFSHIEYRDDKLRNSLMISDAVIMDFPGSSVLEISHHNVNALILYYNGLNIREKACHLSDKITVREFKDIDQGINLIENYLFNTIC